MFVESNICCAVKDDVNAVLEQLLVGVTEAKFRIQDVSGNGNYLLREIWLLSAKILKELGKRTD